MRHKYGARRAGSLERSVDAAKWGTASTHLIHGTRTVVRWSVRVAFPLDSHKCSAPKFMVMGLRYVVSVALCMSDSLCHRGVLFNAIDNFGVFSLCAGSFVDARELPRHILSIPHISCRTSYDLLHVPWPANPAYHRTSQLWYIGSFITWTFLSPLSFRADASTPCCINSADTHAIPAHACSRSL